MRYWEYGEKENYSSQGQREILMLGLWENEDEENESEENKEYSGLGKTEDDGE